MTADARPSHADRGAAPMLSGLRVLDLTQIVAGPTCTRMLADAGAEIVKVELAPHGDRTRFSGLKPMTPGLEASSQSTFYFQHNHSKRSIALDLKQPRGRDLFLALLPHFDVVVENFSPGVMDRMGLGYETLRAVRPDLVMCSISLAGQTGPLAQRPGYDYIGQAYAGVAAMIGEPDGAPAMPAVTVGDTATGITAAMAIGFALLHRDRTGEGQYIDVSLVDTYMQMHEVALPRMSLRKGYAPKRCGSQHPDGGPTGFYRCADGGYIALAVLPHQWKALVDALSMPDLLKDPRFASAPLRRDNNAALKEIVEDWLARFPDREAAVAYLDRFRIPCAPVLSLPESVRHPHLRERGTVRQVHDEQLGSFDIPGAAVRYSGWPASQAPLRAELLGQSNDVVMGELLGLTDAEIAALYEQGVLVADHLLERRSKRSKT